MITPTSSTISAATASTPLEGAALFKSKGGASIMIAVAVTERRLIAVAMGGRRTSDSTPIRAAPTIQIQLAGAPPKFAACGINVAKKSSATPRLEAVWLRLARFNFPVAKREKREGCVDVVAIVFNSG